MNFFELITVNYTYEDSNSTFNVSQDNNMFLRIIRNCTLNVSYGNNCTFNVSYGDILAHTAITSIQHTLFFDVRPQ